MSETLHDAPATGAAAAHEETVSGVGHEHPSDGKYIQIAVILGLITAVEIAIPYFTEVSGLWLALMLALMIAKFAIVVAWFMHLKFDSSLFRRLFVGGLVLAVLVYIAALASFQYFGESGGTVDERREGGVSEAEAEH
jgi:cytochrome c oxidase subunit 4